VFCTPQSTDPKVGYSEKDGGLKAPLRKPTAG